MMLCVACSDQGTSDIADARRTQPPAGDSGTRTADAAGESVADAALADAGSFEPGPEPTSVVRPIPGELTITQLRLSSGVTFRMGESAIIVGPDGTTVLLDVGNSNQDDEVRAAVRELNTQVLTPANGFVARRPLQVDWVVLTHIHGDHVGAFRKLFQSPTEPLEIVHGIVHRGLVDLGAGMNTNDYDEVCQGLRGPLADLDMPLCQAAAEPVCDYAALRQAYPAAHCDGLFWGNLATSEDDTAGVTSYIDLGGGARLTIIGADGFVSDGSSAAPIASFGHDTGDDENARSLIGVVEHGQFRYWFAGDLHGRPSDGPDVESHVVRVAGPRVFDDLGVDVVHAHHHARRTASNTTFVGAAAPMDGRSRNVVAGISAAHLGSPFAEVLAAWGNGRRLGDGRIWVTEVTAGGATSPELVNAQGSVIVQTVQHGLGYRIQAAGAQLRSQAFPSLRSRINQ